MNSPQKAKFSATVTEDNVSGPVSVFVSGSMDMHWYGVCIRQLYLFINVPQEYVGPSDRFPLGRLGQRE